MYYSKLLKYTAVLGMMLCMACAPQVAQTQKKKRVTEREVIDDRPAWVRAKPLDNGHYIGIGSATIGIGDHQQAAKKSALQDLMSEIRVTIASNSVLFQMDKNNRFKDEYESTIRTTTTGDIEGFELVSTYEDKNNYWVYYRLSKSKYQSEKRRKEENAKRAALDFYTRARESERSGDIVTALDFYLKSMMSLKDYWAESTEVTFEGRSIQIASESYTQIQRILDNIEVISPTSQVSLTRRNSGRSQEIQVQAKDRSNNPIRRMPLLARFTTGAGEMPPNYTTNAQGQAHVTIAKVHGKGNIQRLQIEVDLKSLSSENAQDRFFDFLVGKFRVPAHQVTISIEKPVVHISSVERNLGEDIGNAQIANRLRSSLASRGFNFTEDKSKAELWLEVRADTRRGTSSESIFISHLDMNCRVIDASSQNEIFSTNLNDVRGFQLNYERAGMEAYKKTLEQLDREVVRKLLEAVL
jgi:hypothetical protein